MHISFHRNYVCLLEGQAKLAIPFLSGKPLVSYHLPSCEVRSTSVCNTPVLNIRNATAGDDVVSIFQHLSKVVPCRARDKIQRIQNYETCFFSRSFNPFEILDRNMTGTKHTQMCVYIYINIGKHFQI
jgi:hypothetical protein